MTDMTHTRFHGFSKRLLARFPEGRRVRFTQDAERYPHFTVPAGTTGVVTEATDRCIFALLDQPIDGLHDSEWEGVFQYSFEDALGGERCAEPLNAIDTIPDRCNWCGDVSDELNQRPDLPVQGKPGAGPAWLCDECNAKLEMPHEDEDDSPLEAALGTMTRAVESLLPAKAAMRLIEQLCAQCSECDGCGCAWERCRCEDES